MSKENIANSRKSKLRLICFLQPNETLRSVQRRFWNDSEDISPAKLPVFPFYHHGLWSLSRPLTQLRKGWPGFVQIHLIAEWPLCCDVIYGGFKDGPTQFQLDRCPWIWLVADAVLRTNWRNWGEKDFSVKVGGSSCWHLAFSLKPVRKMNFTQTSFLISSNLAKAPKSSSWKGVLKDAFKRGSSQKGCPLFTYQISDNNCCEQIFAAPRGFSSQDIASLIPTYIYVATSLVFDVMILC